MSHRKIGVGIIGANIRGSWGTFAHLPALAALGNIRAVAVATSHYSSAKATAEHFGIAHAFSEPRVLVEHPDVDVVTICVRVPAHFELVKMAISAGKHVYCEWPLGQDTAEAEALNDAAATRGIVHMVGLQARSSPVLAYVRDLIADGAVGTVRSAGLTHSVDWLSRPPLSAAYLQNRASGAHFLSIPGGHSIDALCWLLGEFTSVSAVLKTSMSTLQAADADELIQRSSADQIAVVAELASGVVTNVRLSGASSPGTGIRLEISGDDGDLVVSATAGQRGIQMADLTLQKTNGPGMLETVTVPDRYFSVPPAIRHAPLLNVGEAYLKLAAAIERGESAAPDFHDALERHRSLDQVEAAALTSRL